MTELRTGKVRQILEEKGLHACILKGMDNIFYLTGFRGTEGTAIVTKGDVVLLVDGRYVTYAREVASGCQVIETKGRDQGLTEILDRYGVVKTAFDSINTLYYTYHHWKEMAPSVDFIPLEDDIESIRKMKAAEEVASIRKAITVATDAFNTICGKVTSGMTEKELAGELDYTMCRLGASQPSFETIVASGPRSALPHGQPTSKVIQKGESVVIDFGAQVDGYCSDETATISFGSVHEQIRIIADIVRSALRKGIDSVKVGTPIRDIDVTVRTFIADKGYGDYFRHGTGHGVGIAVHEAPSVTSKAEGLLEEGMVITIEPGIYLPGIGGVRLEDMVLVTSQGPEILTRLKKDIIEI
jgi:Xaa-Pro aminopeptidase